MNDEPIILPINGTLDLHAFAPLDLHTLIPDYLGQCRRQGIPRVRIIHGKGIGTLRRTVHAIFVTVHQERPNLPTPMPVRVTRCLGFVRLVL